MADKSKREIDSIPKIDPKQDNGIVTLNYEELLTEKPRASIKEIDATHRLIKMIDSQKRYSYSTKKSSSK
ncbi:MAG: hypothetical protein KGD64_04350 [Candidatus Heimdallarchaeota archaeon]|nr:hypothetical protein [Candidatus Heimdallarchaeota archaeon]